MALCQLASNWPHVVVATYPHAFVMSFSALLFVTTYVLSHSPDHAHPMVTALLQVTPVINDDGSVTYQASSPDEVAIVKWTASVGLTLTFRDRTRIELRTPTGSTIAYDVLELFPFTSESKRMGIVVRDTASGELSFLQKGADVVMARIVQRNDWLEEETANMAREGLRTLVVARRRLSEATYQDFKTRHHAASVRLEGRNEAMAAVVADTLERDLELLGLTGVEDKLQDDVRGTLELLRNAGIKIWMLTGDKIETATVIAISTKLVARNQYIHQVSKRELANSALTFCSCLLLARSENR
jgi:phospholipid-translocating ATPase